MCVRGGGGGERVRFPITPTTLAANTSHPPVRLCVYLSVFLPMSVRVYSRVRFIAITRVRVRGGVWRPRQALGEHTGGSGRSIRACVTRTGQVGVRLPQHLHALRPPD